RRHADDELLIKAAIAATPKESILDPRFGSVLAHLASEALDAVGPDHPHRLLLLRGAAEAITYHEPETLASIAEDARLLAARSDDPAAHYSVLVIEYLAAMSEPVSVRLALSYEAREHARRHQLTREHGQAARRLLAELFVVGRPDEITQELEELARLARATMTPQDLYWAAAFQATRALMHDPSSMAEEFINAAALLGRRLQIFDSTGTQMLQTFALRYQQGRSREITQHLRTPSPKAPQVLAGTALLALALADAGRLDAARQMLDAVIVSGSITLPRDNFRIAAMGLFGGVAAACGTATQRAILRAGLEPRAAEFCVFGAGGAVFGTNHHWLGRLASADGDRTAAAEHFREANRLCHHAGATFWAERARQDATLLR
ncbi:MAG: hypothetical protein JJE46_00520, partial [Acidimicrobiia bacterium]|nr:hypothetical protein [Acidimicrobiia bacterium]